MVIPERDNWRLGWVPDPWWQGYQDLPYINEPFNDPQSLAHWRDLGYTQTLFTGDMYDMRQPEPLWMQGFRRVFPWQHWSWSVYRMAPGRVLPSHADTYGFYRKLHAIDDINQIWRAVVFLEDWQSGHYFEIDGHAITEWARGEYVAWRGSTPHLAANMGVTDRYTLQITGIPNENPLLQ